jgi:hypothetical protein
MVNFKRRGIKSSPKLPQAFREVVVNHHQSQNQNTLSKHQITNPFSSHLEERTAHFDF